MKRMIYRGQLKAGRESTGLSRLEQSRAAAALVAHGALMTAAAFHWERQLFLYYECTGREVAPEEVAGEAASCLCDWPGHAAPRKWVPMTDVFHFNAPVSKEHWARKAPVERRVGRVAHLKPEMAASYIYYHYQLQEERAFLGDKYEIIAMHENLLFGYQEFPKVIEEPLQPRKLSTSGTPENWNDSRMDLHFQPWEDGHLYFKPVDTVFAYYGE
ncbi:MULTISPECIES: hypothetical protein [Paenibacillus]|uniref:hypothetical protein n=1 Tax=Paenibacillus TaxID=44249 RepID=UPI0022B89CE3|nr:hypothetical protein [Paenibacillus caseinilyticus]MCZ8523542.1 hypothetical protein [Paenibacillus caseinilyticus]